MVRIPGRSSGFWFILLPAPSRPLTPSDSGLRGFRPHLQRRDREGFAPSSLTQESVCAGTLGERDKSCQVQY